MVSSSINWIEKWKCIKFCLIWQKESPPNTFIFNVYQFKRKTLKDHPMRFLVFLRDVFYCFLRQEEHFIILFKIHIQVQIWSPWLQIPLEANFSIVMNVFIYSPDLSDKKKKHVFNKWEDVNSKWEKKNLLWIGHFPKANLV